MIAQEQFARLVRESLVHLDDLPFLASSPLAGLLATADEIPDGASLRVQLLSALRCLQPASSVPRDNKAWRRHDCVYLRHVEGLSVEDVQARLNISGRQMRRDHLAGIATVTLHLWATYARATYAQNGQRLSTGPLPMEPTAETSASEEEEALLAAALATLGNSPSAGPLNVEQTILGAVDTVTRLAESHHVEIRLDLPAQLPPVMVDRAVLRQVLLNLLTSFIEGGDGECVELGGKGDGQGVEIRVTVRGTHPGSRPVSDQRITLSQQLIARQGGSLVIDATRRGETVALVGIPAAPPTTVLVIDDNPDLARLFQRYLWAGGYQMLQANTGSQALRMASDLRPRIITLDVMMPSQDGWEVLRELQLGPNTRDIPVIICSILRERDLAFSLGAADFLAKPVTQQTLLIALERCLGAVPAQESPIPPPRPRDSARIHAS
jgi:CheY-like chemotaxis protein